MIRLLAGRRPGDRRHGAVTRNELVFVQRGFPTPESRDGHDEGWRSTFRQLDALLEAQQVA